jgi:hypothetical protein
VRKCLACGAIALMFASGCHGTTEPGNSLQVTFDVSGPDTTFIGEDFNGEPEISCTFHLTAHATGHGKADWQGGRTIWYAGVDRSVPFDTTGNDPADLYEAFGGARSISAGETLHGLWTVAANVPFEATLEADYTVGAAPTSHASTHFACGPKPRSAPAPVVTSVTVDPPNGNLQIGDTVRVTYHETGAAGVWMTVIDASGAFTAEQIVSEFLATSVDHTVKFVVPTASRIGVPLTIDVHAVDPWLQATGRTLATQLAFADNVPPQLVSTSLEGSLLATSTTGLAGQFGVGDTITLHAYATDNNALGWLVYSLGAPANVRDSAAVTMASPTYPWDWRIVVPPEWAGTPVMSVYVRDAGGLASAAMNSQPGALRFYPRVALPTTAPVQLTTLDRLSDIAYDAKRDLVYAGIISSNQIAVLSPSAMTVQPPIMLPGPPAQMDLSLSGDSLLVAIPSQNAVVVVDLTNTAKPPATIPFTAGASTTPSTTWPFAPSHLRVAANGTMLVLPDHLTHAVDQVVEVNLTTGTQRIRTDAHPLNGTYDWWGDVERTVDRTHIYMLGSCSSHYDVSSDTFSQCGPNLPATGAITFPMSFDAAGDRITYGDYVLDADVNMLWAPTGTVENPPPAVMAVDGTAEYIATGQSLTMARIADRALIERVPLPLIPNRMLMAPNGKWMLVFSWTSFRLEAGPGTRVVRVDLP